MQFNEAVVAAADHLQTEAKKLWECSTINGAWLNELHAQSEYDHLLCVVKALRDCVNGPLMMNGMTASETDATASVRGLMLDRITHSHSPAALVGVVTVSAVHPNEDSAYIHEFAGIGRIPVGAELFIHPQTTDDYDRFWKTWPGGLDEIEAALRSRDEKILELESAQRTEGSTETIAASVAAEREACAYLADNPAAALRAIKGRAHPAQAAGAAIRARGNADALQKIRAEIYTKAQRETAALCAYLCKDMPGGEAIAKKINGLGKESVLPYRVVRYDLSAAETESELREQLILMGWTPPPSTLPNAITGKKWQQLCQEGYRANGIAFCKGDKQGLITDFGKVLWWKQEEGQQT